MLLLDVALWKMNPHFSQPVTSEKNAIKVKTLIDV